MVNCTYRCIFQVPPNRGQDEHTLSSLHREEPYFNRWSGEETNKEWISDGITTRSIWLRLVLFYPVQCQSPVQWLFIGHTRDEVKLDQEFKLYYVARITYLVLLLSQPLPCHPSYNHHHRWYNLRCQDHHQYFHFISTLLSLICIGTWMDRWKCQWDT